MANRFLLFLSLLLLALCVSSTTTTTTTKLPVKRLLHNPHVHETLKVEMNEPTLCDPTVQQYSGYMDVSLRKHYFFWFFESQSNPETDDLILWLNGGPGCSSLLGMLGEKIGPCEIAEDLSEVPNPHTWTANASMIFLDAPNGAGYSHGRDFTKNTKEYAEDAYAFFQLFFAEFPQYQKLKFHIFGESYAGHYIPALAAAIERGNLDSKNIQVNLGSVGIGNGMTGPLDQYPFYHQMACNNSYNIPIFSEPVCNLMETTLPLCLRLIEKCYETDDRNICLNSTIVCNMFQVVPYKFTDVNPYDIRIPCEIPPVCYDFSSIHSYLNLESVQAQLGSTGQKWKECAYVVNFIYQLVGYDWMRPVVDDVVYLLDETDVRVLLYAGDADFIVNHYGIDNLSQKIPWTSQTDFVDTPFKNWTPNGENGGEFRTYGDFTFLRVYNAGHMVPLDVPEFARIMVNDWIHGRPFDSE